MRQEIQVVRAEIRESRAEARQDNQQLRAEMVAGFARLAEAIDALRSEVQQSNHVLSALANHTHDADGLIVFTVPGTAGRQ